MSKLKFYCILPSAFACSLSGYAANITQITDENISNYFRVNDKSLSGVDQEYSFVLAKTVRLPDGTLKKKYTQLYHNVPVYNQTLTSSEINGSQMNWHGDMLADIQDDIQNMKPNLSKDDVLALMQKQLKITNDNVIQNKNANLFVRMNEHSKAELIYLVSFYTEGDGQHPSRPYFLVDAHTGNVIHSWDGLTTKEAQGPGGNEKVGQYYYGRDFSSLQVSDNCSMSTPNVETYDMKNQIAGPGTLFQFVCPVNNYKYVNGAYSPINDAHYFANMVFNMYKDWYSLSPLNGKLLVRVHFGTNLEQAFWNGVQMTFGDGNPTRTYPFTALDVMGHEVSHGVTEKNSDLAYEKQSGGINEAFSDMAGEAVEDYMNQQIGKDNDWVGGAMVIKGAPGSAMRYFKNPPQDGISIDNASKYNDAMDVHHTSGVYNKAFYLLATKPGWDVKKAFGTFLLANQIYWKRESTFVSAACGVVKAASDLKYATHDVISAFEGVGINANCAMPDPNPEPGKETVIPNGTDIKNIAIKANDERRYVINVPVVKTFPYGFDLLYMSLTNANGTTSNSAELFVRYENGTLQQLKPQPSKKIAAADEIFLIKKPAAGNYHIIIKGKATDSLDLTVFYGNNSQLG